MTSLVVSSERLHISEAAQVLLEHQYEWRRAKLTLKPPASTPKMEST